LSRLIRWAIAGLIAQPGAALAQQPNWAAGLIDEVKIGVQAHDVPGLWSGFRLEHGVDINGEILFSPALPFLLGGSIRPALGGTVNTSGDTSRAYLDARWQIEAPFGLFFGLGLGGAIHDGNLTPSDPDRKALGSRVLFHIPLEIGYRFDSHTSLSLFFDHMSNGNLAKYNEGMDNLGIRYGYKF
jgi:lipid A 3-O-deacylase